MTDLATTHEPLEFEFICTRNDAVITNALFSRSGRRKVAAVFGALALVQLGLWLITFDLLALVLFMVAAAISILTLTSASVWLTVRMNESALRVGMKVKVTLKPKGISAETTGLAMEFQWQAVTKVLEDKKAIVLLQGKAPLTLIPKRALASADALQGFKDFVRLAAPNAEWSDG